MNRELPQPQLPTCLVAEFILTSRYIRIKAVNFRKVVMEANRKFWEEKNKQYGYGALITKKKKIK